MIDKQLGENIRAIRKCLGLSAKSLAEKMGSSQQTVSQYESGKRKITVRTIKRVAEVFNLPVSYVVEYHKLSKYEKEKYVTNPEQLRENIKNIRKDLDLTTKELGERLNIAQQNISGYENGGRSITDNVLNKLACAFNVTTQYIMGYHNLDESEKVKYYKSLDTLETKEDIRETSNIDAIFLKDLGYSVALVTCNPKTFHIANANIGVDMVLREKEYEEFKKKISRFVEFELRELSLKLD